MEKKKTWKQALLATFLCCLLVTGLVVGSFYAGAANVGRDNEISGSMWADLGQETYEISTKEALLAWAKDPHASQYEGKIIALGADITFNEGKNASSWASAAPAEKWVPVTGFHGVFDGRGHSVSGLYVSSGGDNVGLFASLGKGAEVRNLFVKNSYFKGNYHVGSVAGACSTATFSGIYSNAIIEAATSNAGGIVGSVNGDGSYKSNVMAVSCWFDGTAKAGSMYASGILGNQNHNNAVVTDCLNTGAITAGSSHAAGISVAVYNGTLTATRCVNLGVCTDLTATTPRKGDSIARTIGGTAKAENSYFVDCYGKISAAELQPGDVRYNTVVEGAVIGLADSFTATDLANLSGFWKMNGAIPVPAYFAAGNALEIPAPEGERLYTPTVVVKDAKADKGGKVNVTVELQGNQGISDMTLKLNYSSALTLVSVTDGTIFNAAVQSTLANPVELAWSTDVNSSANGTLVTLVFEVSDDAEDATVSVAYAEANKANGNAVVLNAESGTVSIVSVAEGDVNGDGAVDLKDATLLEQYLKDATVEIFLSAADMNGDGTVDRADADLLAQNV